MTNTRFFALITCLFILNACVSNNNSWNTQPTTTSNTATPAAASASLPAAYEKSGFENLPPVKVAILLPLSGPKSNLGQSMLQAAQLALFDMGYTNFNLMPRDTKGTAAGASAAAATAIGDGAQLILGPLFADSVRAVKAVAKPNNINVIAFSTDWTLADRSTFLMGFMPFSQVERVAQYATSQGYRNFALIAPRDKYGDLVTGRFEQEVRNNTGRIAQSLRFTPGDPAVINQIARLQSPAGTPANDPPFRAVFMPVGGSQIETISSALSYNKLMPSQIKRLGTGLWDDPRIAGQPNMQGAWFAGPSPRARQNFERQYYATYGQKPVRLGTLAYDATALAAILARNGFSRGSTPAFDYASLTNPSGFSGTDGIFRFQPNGLVERGLAVLELRRGQIVEIDPAPKRF